MNTRTKLPIRRRSAQRARSAERGMSLIEALVAIFIFSIAFITALMLYQTANRTYLRTDAAAVQQQNIRFALDRMSETLRDAGAGHNMLGSNRLADEQIEGAWESAIFVRGDFDGARETELESGDFPIVTTGNDEIVGYVLRKEIPEGGPDPNTTELQIIADFTPIDKRDAEYDEGTISGEETVKVMVAATELDDQVDPPYRLERVTFTKTSPAKAKYEVVADNVFRLSFKYMADDVTSFPVNTATGAGTGSANTERDERAKIRRIQIDLMGMTDRPDLGYIDETVYDPVPPEFTRAHRKFAVSQIIYASNLGIVGGEHNATPPLDLDAPVYITACAGHCRHYLISWPASASPGVTTYSVHVSAPAATGLDAYEQSFAVGTLSYEFTEPDEDIKLNAARTFTFKVAPMYGGNVGEYTQAVARISINDQSTPRVVENVAAAQAGTSNALQVTWDALTENADTITDNTCLSAGTIVGPSAPEPPWDNKAVDLKESKVYRARSNGVNTGSDVGEGDEVTELELGELTNLALSNSFTDNTAAPCSSYFYRVKACDLCDVTSATLSEPMSEAAKFVVEDGVVPAKPSKPSIDGNILFDGTNYKLTLEWAAVTRTAANEKAAVAHYALERWRKLGSSGTFAFEKTTESVAAERLYEVTQSALDTAPAQVSGQTAYYRYYVKAIYDCDIARISEASDPFELNCLAPPGNTLTIAQPAAGEKFYRPGETSVPFVVNTTGTGWTSATLQVTRDGNVVYGPVDGTAGTNKFTFPAWNVTDTDTFPDGFYSVSVTGMVGDCTTASAVTSTFELDSVSCGQRIINAAFGGSGSNFAEFMTFNFENTCPFAVTFNTMKPTWSGVLASVRLRRFSLGTTTNFYNDTTGILSAGTMTLITPLTLTAAPDEVTAFVSPQYRFTFSNNFTNDGDDDGTTGQFSSIVVSVTSPSVSNEELVDDNTPIP